MRTRQQIGKFKILKHCWCCRDGQSFSLHQVSLIQLLFINLLKTKRRPLYLKTQSIPRCKHFSSRL